MLLNSGGIVIHPRIKIRLESLLNIQQYEFNDLKVWSKGVNRQKVQAMGPTSTGTRVSTPKMSSNTLLGSLHLMKNRVIDEPTINNSS